MRYYSLPRLVVYIPANLLSIWDLWGLHITSDMGAFSCISSSSNIQPYVLKQAIVQNTTNFLLGHSSSSYLQPLVPTKSFLHSFVPSTISLWNSLPSNALAHLHFLSLKPTYMHLTCYIESDCLLSAHTPGGALVDLIFTYFVFDIAHPKSIICIAHHFVLGLTIRFQHLFPPRALLCPVSFCVSP